MLYACLAFLALLIIFVLVTFLLTFKTYKFEFEGGQLRVVNVGSHLKIYFNKTLLNDVFSPQLIKGENVDFKIGEMLKSPFLI